MIKVAEVASFIDGHPPPALTPWAPVMKAVNRGTDTAGASPYRCRRNWRCLSLEHSPTNLKDESMRPVRSEERAILIVEDDPELRELLVTLFEKSELEIVECESAEAALATMLLRGRDIVMIFSDVRLPGAMDGFDLAHEAKVRWPHLTVILTSGDPGDRLQSLPPNVIYMPKPWHAAEVLALAESAKSSAQSRTRFGR
jgi:CheY-like chemotaxis protein